MATSLDEIADLLTSAKLHFTREEKFIFVGYEMDLYESPDKTGGIRLIIACERDGSLVSIFAPAAYKIPVGSGVRKFSLVKHCLNQFNWELTGAKYEMDDADGEVRVGLDLILEDAKLTERQLMRSVMLVLTTLDNFHLDFCRALEDDVPVASRAAVKKTVDAYLKKQFKS